MRNKTNSNAFKRTRVLLIRIDIRNLFLLVNQISLDLHAFWQNENVTYEYIYIKSL